MVLNEPPIWASPPFLDRLSPETRDKLLALGFTRTIPSGRRIFTEGAADAHVELIRRGFVKVTTSAGGREQLLAIRLPGDIIGEMAAVSGNDRSATVTACGDVVSTILQRPAFLAFLGRQPAAAIQVTATVGERLNWANERRTDFTTYPVHVRLARVLGEIAVRCGRAVDDGLLIAVELSQPELATLVGAAEDTVQKALRTLRGEGLIRTGYRKIIVVDPEGLRGMGQGGRPT
jgi:CRP/FNR family cyclic AMP-dependent transcriptional regulator